MSKQVVGRTTNYLFIFGVQFSLLISLFSFVIAVSFRFTLVWLIFSCNVFIVVHFRNEKCVCGTEIKSMISCIN